MSKMIIQGDPIETAALRAIKWSFDPETNLGKPSKEWKEACGKLWNKNKNSVAFSYGVDMGIREDIGAALRALAGAQRATSSSKFGVEVVSRNHFKSKLQRMSVVSILHNIPSSSSSDSSASMQMGGRAIPMSLVKGSPEAIKGLLREGGEPEWYVC